MLILAADTSGKYGSLALASSDAGDQVTVLDVVALEGGTFSAQMVPQIAGLLGRFGHSSKDVGGFAAASGPGSFTGLRVGLAAIKGLAEVTGAPIAAVSLLQVVAAALPERGRALACMDAGRGEIYAGEYEVGEAGETCLSESLVTRQQLETLSPGAVAVTPDAAIAQHLRERQRRVVEVARPRADAVARLGWRKLRAGDTVAPDQLEANYIRRSDAEIFSKPVR